MFLTPSITNWWITYQFQYFLNRVNSRRNSIETALRGRIYLVGRKMVDSLKVSLQVRHLEIHKKISQLVNAHNEHSIIHIFLLLLADITYFVILSAIWVFPRQRKTYYGFKSLISRNTLQF
jgi:hypothetical protein